MSLSILPYETPLVFGEKCRVKDFYYFYEFLLLQDRKMDSCFGFVSRMTLRETILSLVEFSNKNRLKFEILNTKLFKFKLTGKLNNRLMFFTLSIYT